MRPDRAALEAGDANAADAVKHAPEGAARRAKDSEEKTRRGTQVVQTHEGRGSSRAERDVGTAVWEWNGEYAAVSAERAAAAEATNPLESNAFDPWCYEETSEPRRRHPTSGRERRTRARVSEVERTPRATSEASMDI